MKQKKGVAVSQGWFARARAISIPAMTTATATQIFTRSPVRLMFSTLEAISSRQAAPKRALVAALRVFHGRARQSVDMPSPIGVVALFGRRVTQRSITES
jgi:hypothetical protein